MQKRQGVHKLVVDQSGADRLILNDLILGYDGAEVVAQLLPQCHAGLQHIEIKGNNINPEGFELIFTALLHCHSLKTISAEWNALGASPLGLNALCRLVSSSRSLEFIDLKNNRITHQSADYLAQLITLNCPSLTGIELRFNQVGEVGAATLIASLARNRYLTYLGLEDNRISTHTLSQVGKLTANPNRMNGVRRDVVPLVGLDDNPYPSMEVQMKTAQYRQRIQHQQEESAIQTEKLQIQIQKVLSKLRTKASQLHEVQTRFDGLQNEHAHSIDRLRETERILTLQQERYLILQQSLSKDLGEIRERKVQLGGKMQRLCQDSMIKNQRELDEIERLMSEKMSRFQQVLKDQLQYKRSTREKLGDLKEDIIKLKVLKEASWNKPIPSPSTFDDSIAALQNSIAKAQSDLASCTKKSDYLAEELSNLVLRGLKKEEKLQVDIFAAQGTIKSMHKQLTNLNLSIEEAELHSDLLDGTDKEGTVEMSKRYVRYLQCQNMVNQDMEKSKMDEDERTERLVEQTMQMRMEDVEKSLRGQMAQNKMVRNQYEKLVNLLQTASKRAIQAILFEK